ncbi:MAG: Gfo/Idh/MocA family oxidoreductase [Candidatus Jidaibacter sp.]|jgi:UDP-N-acetyl-2-amino-2-deoxyglucuronate dehydrogenase|nr:Gfo/Idh/MocA family oxidoreductase [Candidatus Jidaibacter sp.]
MINSMTLKTVYIGCGRISAKHFEALNKITDKFQVVGVCDIDLNKAIKASEIVGGRPFEDYVEMIKQLSPDIAVVATPNGLHPSMVEKIAELGVKNIICEKPLSIDYESGERASNYCKSRGARLFLICQNRFNAPIAKLKQAINEGKLGRIYMISSNIFWQRPQSYYDKEASWHGTLAMDGGAYLTQATHYVDMVAWMAASKPKKVFASLMTLARNIETEDTGATIIEFENGTLASINMTVLTYPKNLEGSITILGEKGTVKIGGIALNEITHWELEGEETLINHNRPIPKLASGSGVQGAYGTEDRSVLNIHEDLSTGATTQTAAEVEFSSVYGAGHVHNYIDVYSAIISGKPASIEGDTILTTQKILSAIYKSNNLNAPIDLL